MTDYGLARDTRAKYAGAGISISRNQEFDPETGLFVLVNGNGVQLDIAQIPGIIKGLQLVYDDFQHPVTNVSKLKALKNGAVIHLQMDSSPDVIYIKIKDVWTSPNGYPLKNLYNWADDTVGFDVLFEGGK